MYSVRTVLSAVTAVLILPLLSSCAEQTSIVRPNIATVNSISVAVNFFVSLDFSDAAEVVDIQTCKDIAAEIAGGISRSLEKKGYIVADQYVSVSRAEKMSDSYHTITTEAERKYEDPSQLPMKSGVLFSDKLNGEQIERLYNAITSRSSLPFSDNMPLNGELILFLSVDGQIRSTGNKVARGIANTFLAILYGVGGGSGGFLAVRDAYQFKQGIYTKQWGQRLMSYQNTLNVSDVNIVDHTIGVVDDSIPRRQ